MRLPTPPPMYSSKVEAARNQILESEDRQNLKRGRDIELGDARVILRSPDGTRYALTVANGGTLSCQAV